MDVLVEKINRRPTSKYNEIDNTMSFCFIDTFLTVNSLQ